MKSFTSALILTGLALCGSGQARAEGWTLESGGGRVLPGTRPAPQPTESQSSAQPAAGTGDVGGAGEASGESGAVEGLDTKLAYGLAGSKSFTLGTGWAPDFDGSLDANFHASFNYFLVNNVEISFEAGLWHFNQPGDNEGGLSGSMVFRWHFVNEDPWTLFVDAGIGVLGTSGNVPDGGTSLNFLPRLGVGGTYRLTDDGLRLIAGLRWHHISNARIQGDEDNPARYAPMLYAGLVFPF